ncbi:MAG: hypothetical protein ACOX3S_01610 [Anaerolineae bacterium]
MIVVAQMLAGTIGSLVCIVGVAFTSFYAQLVTADLIGQVAADAAAASAHRAAGAAASAHSHLWP